jgi:hypothetical protein
MFQMPVSKFNMKKIKRTREIFKRIIFFLNYTICDDDDKAQRLDTR